MIKVLQLGCICLVKKYCSVKAELINLLFENSYEQHRLRIEMFVPYLCGKVVPSFYLFTNNPLHKGKDNKQQ